jgi:hypothetical protein
MSCILSSFVSSRTRCEGNEEHEDRALWVAVADCGRHGGEPFLRVALLFMSIVLLVQLHSTDIEFILDDFVVV